MGQPPIPCALGHVSETMHVVLTQPDTALTVIRERCAAAKGRVFLLVPEIGTAKYFKKVLADLGVLTVGTRKDLFRAWDHLTDIIVEDPLHEAYKSDMTPRYAAPDVARELARIHGASLTYLSPALSATNQYLIDKNIFTLTNLKPHWPEIVMADMTQERSGDNRSILSRHAQDLILDDQRRILFYSPRRAYASLLRCHNCHKSAACTTCTTPMRVHRTSEDMLVCYHCGAYRALPKRCSSCQSGQLRPSGIAGSQKIIHAINDYRDRHGMSKLDIPILDSDLVKTDKDEREVLRQLDESESGILVATQMIFSHRYERTFDHIVVVGADALAYNPDFRTQERLVYQLEKLADFTPRTLTIQYWDDRGAVSHAPHRNWLELYTSELAERKSLNWPPFSRIIKLSLKHRDKSTSSRQAAIAADRLRRAVAHLKATKAVEILGPTPALVERAGGAWKQQIIIKTSLNAEKLRELLSYVPAAVMIDVDPRSIS